MPEYVHGGDVYSYAEAYGGAPLDLSANINPFGIPERVKQAMHDAVEDCTRYSDPFCRAARRAIRRTMCRPRRIWPRPTGSPASPSGPHVCLPL